MKKSRHKDIFRGKVRKNQYRWSLPVSVKLLRSLGINQNSKFEINVDAEKNILIFHFLKKPVGFLGYRLNLINEFILEKNKEVVDQIEKNEEWAKKNLPEEAKRYLFSDSNNQARLKDLNEEKKFYLGQIERIDGEIEACQDYENMKEDQRAIYRKKKTKKL